MESLIGIFSCCLIATLHFIAVDWEEKRIAREALMAHPDVIEAQRWLHFARGLLSNNYWNIKKIREHAKKAGASLDDLGTSEDELNSLLKLRLIAEAKMFLNWVREAPVERHHLINEIRSHTEKAGVSLQEIGTNEGELNNLPSLSDILSKALREVSASAN